MFLSTIFSLAIIAFAALLQVECTRCGALVNPIRGPIMKSSNCPVVRTSHGLCIKSSCQKFKKPPNCKLVRQCQEEKWRLTSTTTTTTVKPTVTTTTTTVKPTVITTTTTVKPTVTTTATTTSTTAKVQTTTTARSSTYKSIYEMMIEGLGNVTNLEQN